MAPPSWATDAERAFLKTFIPEYQVCQEKRRYKPFWQRVSAEFLVKFPVVDKIFPGLKVTDLTHEQVEVYKGAIVRQQKRLKEWFRWQCNPRARGSKGGLLLPKDVRNSTHNGGDRVNRTPREVDQLQSKDLKSK